MNYHHPLYFKTPGRPGRLLAPAMADLSGALCDARARPSSSHPQGSMQLLLTVFHDILIDYYF